MTQTRTFTLGDILSGYENQPPEGATTFITDISGWDEGEVQIITVPALFEDGSYPQEFHVPEQDITITVFFDGVNIHNIMSILRQRSRSFAPVTATRSYSGGSTVSKELYIIGITGIGMIDDALGEITIKAKCLKP